MKLYLAHPLIKRKEIREIELEIERDVPWLRLENPFYDAICGNVEDVKRMDSQQLERDDDTLDFRAIVETDLRAVASCDGLVMYIEKGTYTIGTLFEAWKAMDFGKRVYVVSPDSLMHPWIRYILWKSGGQGFSTWEDFKKFWVDRMVFYGGLIEAAQSQ